MEVVNPLCPYCGTETVPMWMELDDGSGYVFGWTCTCDDVKDIEKRAEGIPDKGGEVAQG